MARQFHTTASVVLTASREQEARALALPIALASLLPSDWPLDHPLVRIQTCGCSPIIIEVLQGFDEQMQPIYAPPDEHLWSISGMTTAPILLEMLASQPGCVVSQDWLMQGLRQRRKAMQKSQADGENDEDDEELKRPDNVVSLLRKLLYPPALLHLPERSQRAIRLYLVAHVKASRESGPSYRLAGAPLIWLDVEAMEMHAKQVKVLEQFGEDALHAWQAIAEIGLRGSFLPHEPYSDWAQWRRARVSDLLWQSVNIQQQRARQQADQPAGEETALRLLLAFWRGHLTNQDAFRQLAELLGKREHFQQAEECYAQLCTALENDGRELHERTKQVMEFVRAKQIQRKQTAIDSIKPHTDFLSTPFPRIDQQAPLFPGFSYAGTQDIIETSRAPERDFMNQPRRQFLQQTFLTGTGVAFLAAHNAGFSSEITERLVKALCKPSHIDENTLLYLEKRIEHYWQDRNIVALPAWNLLTYVLEDLHKVTMLLDAPLPSTTRARLCTIAGVAAMLVGELYYDLRNYPQARNFQSLAVTAAHEANNADLEAVAWGRNSFAWTYDGKPIEARNSIQQARHLEQHISSTIRTWLAAVGAEIQANLGERDACLRALKVAAEVEDKKYHGPDCYWIHFDQSLLAGYQGVSFLKLSSRGHHDLLQNAQGVLQDALNLLDPSMKRRQPTLLVDLAGTYIQQKNIEQACSYAIEAANVARQINSNVLLQRFLMLKSTLEPWKETPYVQDLDRSMAPLLSAEKA